jgi:deoxyribonuclease-4
LNPEITDLYIVLPLQTLVWHRDVRDWTNRDKYLETLIKYSAIDVQSGSIIQLLYGIGSHIKKCSTLLDTVKQVDGRAPYQIFLNGPQCSKISVSDLDIASTNLYIEENGLNIYVHTPYILNLASEFKEGEWQYTLFRKYIEISCAIGAKGVVIHVAKHTKQSYENAITTMKKNLESFLEYASEQCPILLETPAGQGTETLKDMNEFCEFVQNFKDNRIRACVDTCHVFACGHDPLEYVTKMVTEYPSMLKLVHFNDSKDVCGSCLDRHAYIGTGHIGTQKMSSIAMYCNQIGIPMVVE